MENSPVNFRMPTMVELKARYNECVKQTIEAKKQAEMAEKELKATKKKGMEIDKKILEIEKRHDFVIARAENDFSKFNQSQL